MSNEKPQPVVLTGVPLIFKKMSQVMSEVGSVGKDQRNAAQGFAFRGIDQFINALYPALVNNGVFMTPRCVSQKEDIREVERSNGRKGVDKTVSLLMEYDFYAEDGSKVTIGPIPAEGLDSGDKATNKALSAGLKYALIQTFTVPTKDMEEADKDSPTHSPPVRNIVKEIEAKAKASGSSNVSVTASTTSVGDTKPATTSSDKKTVAFKRNTNPPATPVVEQPKAAASKESEPEIEM